MRALRLGAVTVDPPVILAPLAGFSALPMRLLSRRAGAGMVCSEMVSALGLRHGNRATRELLQTCRGEHPVSIQLFGCDPGAMARAAQQAVAAGADVVDLNLGCTVPKVMKTGAGAALMHTPETAVAVVREVAQAVTTPVTVKFRAVRIDDRDTYLELGVRFAEAGAAALVLHARGLRQRFSGSADLSAIARLVREVDVPVIGNGDVDSPAAARRMWDETGCAAVMVGRAAIGNPWIFAQITADLRGEVAPPPSPRERVAVALCHAQMQAALQGERRGMREMRPALARYVAGLPGAAAIRARLMTATTLAEVRAALWEVWTHPGLPAGGRPSLG